MVVEYLVFVVDVVVVRITVFASETI